MAGKNKKKKTNQGNSIAQNRRARHDYYIEDRFEAGLVLEGWEVKSLRDGRAQLQDSYINLIKGEAWLVGMHVSPLLTASTHVSPENTRPRKLLLNRNELNKLIGAVDRKGYTLMPLSLYWVKGRVKAEIATAKGKQQHDKRSTEKDRDWARDKARVMRKG